MSKLKSDSVTGQDLPPEGTGIPEVAENQKPGKKRGWKSIIRRTAVILLYLLFLPFLLLTAPALSELVIPRGMPDHRFAGEADAAVIKKMNSEITLLTRRIERFTPGNAFLVVNTTENRFALYRNRKLVREGLCSTGSYISLEGEGDQKWTFKTPRGEFRVRGKITNPVWRKPDWAFVEEGLPIPSANHPSRYERGVLGDYALALGDGYLIHGTLYQRFLGLPVTHGCIRMNDADLKDVYETLPVGAKVFIY